jgi:hypothetical protein
VLVGSFVSLARGLGVGTGALVQHVEHECNGVGGGLWRKERESNTILSIVRSKVKRTMASQEDGHRLVE